MNTLSSLLSESADGQLGILMSALSGIAAALTVALAMTVYFRMSYRTIYFTWRDVVRHGLAALAVIALLGFAAYDMRHAALGNEDAGKALERLRCPYGLKDRDGNRSDGSAVTAARPC